MSNDQPKTKIVSQNKYFLFILFIKGCFLFFVTRFIKYIQRQWWVIDAFFIPANGK